MDVNQILQWLGNLTIVFAAVLGALSVMATALLPYLPPPADPTTRYGSFYQMVQRFSLAGRNKWPNGNGTAANGQSKAAGAP